MYAAHMTTFLVGSCRRLAAEPSSTDQARLVLNEELRAAPNVDEQLVRLRHVLNLHRGRLAARGNQRRGRDQVDRIAQRRLCADLRQQLLSIICAAPKLAS